MQLNEYQKRAMLTCLTPCKNIQYMALKLCSESGEVAGKVGKYMRGDGQFNREAMKQELGDVLWYVAGCCEVLELELEDIAQINLAKLQDRAVRGVIKGSGDAR